MYKTINCDIARLETTQVYPFDTHEINYDIFI